MSREQIWKSKVHHHVRNLTKCHAFDMLDMQQHVIHVAELLFQIFVYNVPTKAQKGPKNTKYAFFACFRAYVRQPHGHIG